MDVEIGATKDGTITALKVTTVADHGAFDAAADPTKYPAGLVRHRHRVVRLSDRVYRSSTRTLRTRRRAASPIAARSASPKRRMPSSAAWICWRASSAWIPPSCALKNFVKKEQFPYPSPLGFVYDSGDYHHDAAQGAREDRLRRPAQGAGREAHARRADGHRHLDLHRSRRRRAEQALRHHGHQDVRQRRDPHPSDRLGHRARRHAPSGPRPRDDVGADRRRRARPRSAKPARRRRRHRHRALRPGHVREPQHAGRRRRARDGGAPRAREGQEDRRALAGSVRRRRRVERLQVQRQRRSRQDASR